MNFFDFELTMTKAAPGVFGSLLALRWMVGTWKQKLTSFVGGAVSSFYGAPYVAAWANLESGLAGFLVGLFGMAIVAKCFEVIEQFKPTDLIDRFFGKKVE